VSAFHHLFTNPSLWGAIALSFVLQLAVVYVPILNEAFDTTSLDASDWLLCVGMASTVLWGDEVRKVIGRALARRRRSKRTPGAALATGSP
jgi:P-type Ca2+ transporter type 2C